MKKEDLMSIIFGWIGISLCILIILIHQLYALKSAWKTISRFLNKKTTPTQTKSSKLYPRMDFITSPYPQPIKLINIHARNLNTRRADLKSPPKIRRQMHNFNVQTNSPKKKKPKSINKLA